MTTEKKKVETDISLSTNTLTYNQHLPPTKSLLKTPKKSVELFPTSIG
jgi:hypothetical protein